MCEDGKEQQENFHHKSNGNINNISSSEKLGCVCVCVTGVDLPVSLQRFFRLELSTTLVAHDGLLTSCSRTKGHTQTHTVMSQWN